MRHSENENETEPEAEVAPAGTRPEPRVGRFDVIGTQVCASTLASVSAAVVASIFGVAGTVVGAAVVSVIATTGSAVYSHGIRQTGVKLQRTQAVRLTRPLNLRKQRGAATPPNSGSIATNASGWRDWLPERHWGVAAGIALVFVASLATITLVELVGRQPLAAISGNDPPASTSIGSLFDDGGQDLPDETPATTDSPGSTTSTDADTTSEPSTTSIETTEPSTPTTSEE